MTSNPDHAQPIPSPVIRTMAALGSSFAAGPGIEPVLDSGALRSGRNYPHLIADRLGAELVDLTVSGATTATILTETHQTMTGATYPPQIEGIPANAELVTVTAGGNDLQLLGSMLFAAWSNLAPESPITQMLAQGFTDGIHAATQAQVNAASDGLERIVDAARNRATAARIVLVDYLTILSVDAAPTAEANLTVNSPFTRQQFDVLRGLHESVAEAHQLAQGRSGADLVTASVFSRRHGVGSARPWVFGFEPDMTQTVKSFHPNADGMLAVADAVLERLRHGPHLAGVREPRDF
ncbi:SGNH/GDSL hydrolase family protein [Subtercola frigoramans]|uniref:Lysophospholipase L1-like esterase n=1 Tax=Subtercola frigoramans TaxID=120298 RepID=A0ABS2L123_9MICO|nr:SGNH/GDSL hydrolase family protein [Subtercola frigoramans]MBM7470646.1 lysophospholipase L1-like esterase [Subtercola frigoramans]